MDNIKRRAKDLIDNQEQRANELFEMFSALCIFEVCKDIVPSIKLFSDGSGHLLNDRDNIILTFGNFRDASDIILLYLEDN